MTKEIANMPTIPPKYIDVPNRLNQRFDFLKNHLESMVFRVKNGEMDDDIEQFAKQCIELKNYFSMQLSLLKYTPHKEVYEKYVQEVYFFTLQIDNFLVVFNNVFCE